MVHLSERSQIPQGEAAWLLLPSGASAQVRGLSGAAWQPLSLCTTNPKSASDIGTGEFGSNLSQAPACRDISQAITSCRYTVNSVMVGGEGLVQMLYPQASAVTFGNAGFVLTWATMRFWSMCQAFMPFACVPTSLESTTVRGKIWIEVSAYESMGQAIACHWQIKGELEEGRGIA